MDPMDPISLHFHFFDPFVQDVKSFWTYFQIHSKMRTPCHFECKQVTE